MNEKEIAELRRRFRPEKTSITHIRGCCVNENREIVSQFDQSLALLSQEESELLLSTVRRTLSGGVGKTLVHLEVETAQVVDSPEHKLLMALRDSQLQDQDAVEAFFQQVAASFRLEDMGYLILLAYDSYDVPYRGKDGGFLEDASETVYSYILCSLCPVKETKPVLSYRVPENLFRNREVDWVIAPPEAGFLFPAFDDRATNIYNALYYTHDITASQDGLIEAVFNTPVPQPAAEQKKSFEALLTTSLGEDCSLDVVQTVHDQLCQRIELHKESKVPEPLMISKEDVKEVLTSCGVSQEHLAKFSVDYDETFGFEADLHPKNIIDNKHFEVKTPDVVIKVDPARSDLIETRVICGVKYILISADENVEVNGVNINIADSEKEMANV